MWTYRCYDDGSSPNLWSNWYYNTPDVMGSHDSVFSALEQMTNWRPPYTKIISHKREAIVEVRLSGAVEWRVFGFYGPTRMEFVALGVGYHKQRVYYPADILNTVVRRKKETELDITRAISCARPK